MMCRLRYFFLTLFLGTVFSFSAPMESLTQYNVILVHGAADSLSGMNCSANNLDEAATYVKNGTLERLDGGVEGLDESNATGMINPIKDWLKDTVFEGASPFLVYLNRPFKNPANTPAYNAHEIGDRKWIVGGKNNGNCSKRRALIEEAQEVVVGNRKELITKRYDVDAYRAIPSRNIIISHSMGGLASCFPIY